MASKPRSVCLARAAEDGDQQPAELLGVDQARALRVDRLDHEAVLAVEDTGDPELATPSQLGPLERSRVGRIVIGFPEPRASFTLSGLPATNSPGSSRTKGFHSGCARSPSAPLPDLIERRIDLGSNFGLVQGALLRVAPL